LCAWQTKAPEARISWWTNAGAGVLAAGACRCLVAPFDVLKIRFQLQQAPVGLFGAVGKAAHLVKPDSGYYTSLLQATRAIVAEEGVQALWRCVARGSPADLWKVGPCPTRAPLPLVNLLPSTSPNPNLTTHTITCGRSRAQGKGGGAVG
jgi:hypothetical protein